MSQIASFYLIKNNQRKELSDGNCSGAVYMAIWDWCRATLPCCMKCYKAEGYHAGKAV